MKQIMITASLVVLLAGCGREEPTSYEVPKETQPANPHQSMQPSTPMMGSQSDNELVAAAHAAMSAQMPDAGFSAELPDGWTEKGASGMRLASYAIDGTSIDFYLTSLTIGDVPSNVNRWRGQVGLEPASGKEIASDLQIFEADGHVVSYIEIYNEEDGNGIIAAIVDLAPKYWYFTAKGTVDELKANAGAIRTFIESIKIN